MDMCGKLFSKCKCNFSAGCGHCLGPRGKRVRFKAIPIYAYRRIITECQGKQECPGYLLIFRFNIPSRLWVSHIVRHSLENASVHKFFSNSPTKVAYEAFPVRLGALTPPFFKREYANCNPFALNII